ALLMICSCSNGGSFPLPSCVCSPLHAFWRRPRSTPSGSKLSLRVPRARHAIQTAPEFAVFPGSRAPQRVSWTASPLLLPVCIRSADRAPAAAPSRGTPATSRPCSRIAPDPAICSTQSDAATRAAPPIHMGFRLSPSHLDNRLQLHPAPFLAAPSVAL